MDSTAKLCEVCSKLDLQLLTRTLHPCRKPMPCSSPPIKEFGKYLSLGSVDEIKHRRSACGICSLVADCLDREPADLDGQCRITESAEFCNFKLPAYVHVTDPSITHFHLTQVCVIFDTYLAHQFQGPALPWEAKEKATRSTHYILNLQVKSKSCQCVKGGRPGRFPPTEENFLAEIGGRQIGTQADTQLIRAWLHQCESEHRGDCMLSWNLPEDRDKNPTFVIDVIQSCLVNTPSRCRYVALSYVWGTARVFMHVTKSTKDLCKEGSLLSLPIPATIRDSMSLVRAIGERYLWVDSLCIIQDDLMMQQSEILQMASIYSKALFTIIAASGDHADSGLPGIRPGSRKRVQKILKLGDSELLTFIDFRTSQHGIDATVWAQRAWTFQERILSNRVLVFTENQVYWNCLSASNSEESALEQVQGVRWHHSTFTQTTHSNNLPRELLAPSGYSYIYDDLLSTYRRRRLTYNTDLLNAFSGIYGILAALHNDNFVWGLPESLFTFAMTWFFVGHSKRNYVEVPVLGSNGSKQVVPFPSWSWAAWSEDDLSSPPGFRAALDEHTALQPVTHFYIVDGEHQLVKIKERLQVDYSGNNIRAVWQKQQPTEPPILTQRPLPRMGQLRFWTSFANVRASREMLFERQKRMVYRLCPPRDYQPDAGGEIVHQDFIVIAARDISKQLILLAIEWRDGVAYRIGDANVWEEDWVRLENREWRLITLG